MWKHALMPLTPWPKAQGLASVIPPSRVSPSHQPIPSHATPRAPWLVLASGAPREVATAPITPCSVSALLRWWWPWPPPSTAECRRPWRGSQRPDSVLFKLLDHLLSQRIEPDLQAGWADATIGARRGRQAKEAHAALQMAVCHAGREYNRPVVLAKIDFRKAFDKCRQGKVLETALGCTDKRADASVSVGGHHGVEIPTFRRDRGVQHGQGSRPSLFVHSGRAAASARLGCHRNDRKMGRVRRRPPRVPHQLGRWQHSGRGR